MKVTMKATTLFSVAASLLASHGSGANAALLRGADSSDSQDSRDTTAAPTVFTADGTCPESPDDADCAFISPPPFVKCGDNDCNYPTLCWAVAAGFAEEDCTEICPRNTVEGSTCMDDHGFEPVTCIKKVSLDEGSEPVLFGKEYCYYHNLCDAKEAGWKEDECFPDGAEGNDDIDAYNESFYNFDNEDDEKYDNFDMCPESAEDADCLYMSPPRFVKCGEDDCQYSSLCWAVAAGFDAAECADVCPRGGPDAHDTCVTSEDADVPVSCGEDYCWYYNLCEAKEAGWTEEECVVDGN